MPGLKPLLCQRALSARPEGRSYSGVRDGGGLEHSDGMGVPAETQRLRLVLLPGMDGTGELVAEFAAALSGEFDVTTVRYPAGQPLSYAELENFVRDFCPASEPFVMVAESYATPAAIRYAAGRRGNLRGLILCVGFATNPLRGWQRYFARMFTSVMFYLPLPDFAARRWLVGRDAPASLPARIRTAIASVKRRVLAERLRSILAADVRKAAGEIAVPVLHIRAREDRLISAECAEELERANPKIVTVSLDGPHGLLERYPRVVAETVGEFVRSHCV